MTSPSNQDNPPQDGSDSGSAQVRRPPRLLAPVQYLHRDPILGREHIAHGVVVAVGDVLTVRPLAGHTVQVDPADVSPLTADDL